MPRIALVAGFLVVFAPCRALMCQEVQKAPATPARPDKSLDQYPLTWVEGVGETFDIGDYVKRGAFYRLRRKIENSAIDVLSRRARGEQIDVSEAALLLANIGTTQKAAIDALCDNLDAVTPYEGGPFKQPLPGFDVAHALIRIGTPLAFEGLLNNLKGPLPRKELLIIAHVMRRMDDPRVVATRIKIAFEDAPAGEAGATYRANLKEVQRLLDSPDELNDRKNWPLLMDFPKRQSSTD